MDEKFEITLELTYKIRMSKWERDFVEGLSFDAWRFYMWQKSCNIMGGYDRLQGLKASEFTEVKE